jgi:radical SAM superfamily enzyme YgiQ (UPF0313 family)
MIFLTHGYFLNEDPKEQQIMKPYVPLGILYISAWLEKNEVENFVFDATFSSFEEMKRELRARNPPLIGIYTNLMTKLNVLKIISFVKSELSNSKIILGGPEIRHYAKEYLDHGADMLAIGEGEETMLEICRYFSLHEALPQNCAGTAFIINGQLHINDERSLLRDINALPFPNRKRVNMSLYMDAWKKHHGKSMISVSTMRGCPYTCKWCSRAVYGGTYRRRSPALVAEELLEIKNKYAPDAVWFVDDVFTISHKWLSEFAAEVKSKNAAIPYEIITRADRMNEGVILLLKESGCFRIWIGAESGSQEIIDSMDRRVKVEQVREMIQLAKKNGIEAGTFIMLGYPGETKKHIRETIRHLQLSDPDHYTVTITYPIKGTPLYAEVEKNILNPIHFHENTDREIDFARVHPKKYYEYAVRWVYNEVNGYREKNPLRRLRTRMKAGLAQAMMMLNA